MWGWRVIRNGYRTTQGTQIGDTELDADKYQRDGHVLCPRRRYNQERWQNIIQAITIKLQRLQWLLRGGSLSTLHVWGQTPNSIHMITKKAAILNLIPVLWSRFIDPHLATGTRRTRKYPRIYKQAPVFLLDGTLRTNPWDLLVTRCYPL